MALYRCAACGSPNVVTDTQKEGYDYVKGAIGTVVLGVGGAVAGINGKTKKVYKCPDCGLTLNNPMSFEIQTLIDIGVRAPASRKNLQLNGVPIDWEAFTSKYKNIERDLENCVATMPVAAPAPTQSLSNTEVVQPTAESERNKVIYKVAKITYEKACWQWVLDCRRAQEQLEKETAALTSKENARLQEEITNARDSKVKEHSQKKVRYEAEKTEAESKLLTLGPFQFGAKNDTKKRIEYLSQMIAEAEHSISDVQQAYKDQMDGIQSKVEQATAKAKEQLKIQYSIPPKPQKPECMLEYTESGERRDKYSHSDLHYQEDIFRYIERHGTVSFSEIKKGCMFLAGLTDGRISEWITALKDNDEIINISDSYCVNYNLRIQDHSNAPISEDDWSVYESYIAEQAAAKAKRDEKKKTLDDLILDALKNRCPMTCAEIMEQSPELKQRKKEEVFSRLVALSMKGKVKEILDHTVDMGRSYALK